MTPIERVSARSKALSILGLEGNPTKSEVRKVFRKLAFELHPDRGNDTSDEFARVSDAYQLLFETAEDEPAPAATASARVSRPSVRATETEFSEEILNMCQEMAEDDGAQIATRLYRKGRMLTYFVPREPNDGLTKVVLPTGDLVDSRTMTPQVVDVWSGEISMNQYEVSPQLCAQLFPGARSVQIRFGSVTQH